MLSCNFRTLLLNPLIWLGCTHETRGGKALKEDPGFLQLLTTLMPWALPGEAGAWKGCWKVRFSQRPRPVPSLVPPASWSLESKDKGNVSLHRRHLQMPLCSRGDFCSCYGNSYGKATVTSSINTTPISARVVHLSLILSEN